MKTEGGNVWFAEPEDVALTWYEAIVIYSGLLAIGICSIGLIGMLVGYLYGVLQ